MTPFYNQSYERMNKIYAILFLSLFASLSATAQLSGSGYYRIKNKATGKYATLASDEMSYEKVVEGIGGTALFFNRPGARSTVVAKMGCYLENDIRQVDNGAVNPASIFYLEQQGKQYNLKGQGTDLHTITKGVYNSSIGPINFPGYFTNVTATNGCYSLFIKVQTVGNYYFCDNDGTFGVEKDASKKEEAQWYIEPATTFNVKPLEKVKDAEGHYYTTLCVDFPFSIPSTGSTVLAAYIVSGKDEEGNAVLSRVNGTVAGGTPVVLECSSADEATNILNIEKDAPANKSCANGSTISSDGNALMGRYFNAPAATYQYKNYLNQVNNPSTANFGTSGNVLKNDQANYRVLNCVDGKVGFYKLKGTATTMAANKAFLDIRSLKETTSASAKSFAIEDAQQATGIHEIDANHPKHDIIYDLQGRRVKQPAQHGIYIVNGKKVIF